MSAAGQTLTIKLPLAVWQQCRRKRVLTPNGDPARAPARVDSTLVKALAQACRWRRMMQTAWYGAIGELAAAEKISSSYVSRLLRLTLLAPDIVEAILDGRPSGGVTLPAQMEPLPVEWARQKGRPLPPPIPLNGGPKVHRAY